MTPTASRLLLTATLGCGGATAWALPAAEPASAAAAVTTVEDPSIEPSQDAAEQAPGGPAPAPALWFSDPQQWSTAWRLEGTQRIQPKTPAASPLLRADPAATAVQNVAARLHERSRVLLEKASAPGRLANIPALSRDRVVRKVTLTGEASPAGPAAERSRATSATSAGGEVLPQTSKPPESLAVMGSPVLEPEEPLRVEAADLQPPEGRDWPVGAEPLADHRVAGAIGGVNRLPVPVQVERAGWYELWVERMPLGLPADFFTDERPPVLIGADGGEDAGRAHPHWRRVGEVQLPAGPTAIVVVAREPGYALRSIRLGERRSASAEDGAERIAFD